MPSIGTLLKEIWANDCRWVLCYCASTDDYVMEITKDVNTFAIVRAFTVEDVVRKVWAFYYGDKKI